MSTTCKGLLRSGQNCRYRAKVDGYCKLHQRKTEDCVICLEETNDYVQLPCHHKFHLDCIKKWLIRDNKTCPTCRAEITQKAMRMIGIVPDLKLEVIRSVEKFFGLGNTQENIPNIVARYCMSALVISNLLKEEQLMRIEIISYLKKRITTKRGEKEVRMLEKEISDIRDMVAQMAVIGECRVITDANACVVQRTLNNIKLLQRWEHIR